MKKAFVAAAFLAAIASNAAADSLKIDFRMNIRKQDGRNSLTLTIEGASSETKTRDGFDAATGASMKRSTKTTRTLLFDQQKRQTMPKGLRALLLFPVSDFSLVEKDSLRVEHDAENPRKITVTFNHRGNFYRIESDGKGKLDTESSFTIAEGIMEQKDGVFVIKEEFRAEQPECAVPDMEKIEFTADKRSENAEKPYTGKLKIKEKDGILTISGKLGQ